MNKTNQIKTEKGKQNICYDNSHSFFKYRDVEAFKKLSIISKFQNFIEFHSHIMKLKSFNTKNRKEVQEMVLKNAETIFHELYDIFRMKHGKNIIQTS